VPTPAPLDLVPPPRHPLQSAPAPGETVRLAPSAARPLALATSPQAALTSRLAAETAVLSGALRSLRKEHDGTRALVTLREYRARFANGELGGEADRLTVEALVAVGERGEALTLLQRLDLRRASDLPLRLLRAELAAPGGCAQAVADFDAVIAADVPVLLERALHGRALCRARLGMQQEARSTSKPVHTAFPGGGAR
jgi:hypothetical protein